MREGPEVGTLIPDVPIRSCLFRVDDDYDATPVGTRMRAVFREVMLMGDDLFEGGASVTQVCYLLHLARSIGARTIVEVGFNVGFSSLGFLEASPNTRVVSFELNRRPCVDTAKTFIDSHYPGRHTLVIGDSRETLPLFASDPDGGVADLVLVDGGHDYDLVTSDIRNAAHLARDNAVVVVDDLTPWYPWGRGPTRAWQEAIEDGRVTPLEIVADGIPVDTVEGPGDRCWAVGRFRPGRVTA